MDIQKSITAAAVLMKTHRAAVDAANKALQVGLKPIVEKLRAQFDADGIDRAAARDLVYPAFAAVYDEKVKVASRGPKAGSIAFVDSDCAARKAADRFIARLFGAWDIEFAFSEKEKAAAATLAKLLFGLTAENEFGKKVPAHERAAAALMKAAFEDLA